jgi:16S rRNA C967 or C1407 C5-methylase (RsmB/RsmF family)
MTHLHRTFRQRNLSMALSSLCLGWSLLVGSLAHAQEAVSQVPALLLDLASGQRVLDLCAAPGGKTAQIAFALGNRGTLIANDISNDRIKALQGNLDRLGIVNVSTICSDGANWPAAGPLC